MRILRAVLTAWFAAAVCLSFAALPGATSPLSGAVCPMGEKMDCCESGGGSYCPMQKECSVSCCPAPNTIETSCALPPMLLPAPAPAIDALTSQPAIAAESSDPNAFPLERPDPPPRA